MVRYLIDRGSAPSSQGQAAFVRSSNSAGMLTEVLEVIQDARLIGWDLSGVADIEGGAIDEVERLARRWHTLVVVIDAQPRVIRKLMVRESSNLVVGDWDLGEPLDFEI